jgi:hypothetical protein
MTRRFLLLAILYFSATASYAAGPRINALDSSMCNLSEPGESGWYMRHTDKNGSVSVECLVALPGSSDVKEPTMKIDGVVISLKDAPDTPKKPQKPWENVAGYTSQDGKIRVTLSWRLHHDSCKEEEEKCCGQEYLGELKVSTPAGKKKLRVWQSSGS